MQQKDMIQLAEIILAFMADKQEASKEVPQMIGRLNQVLGINGFKKCEVGTPVFDIGDKYMVLFESLDGKISVEVKYYKNTLASSINFDEELC
jgi:hypothetical protein